MKRLIVALVAAVAFSTAFARLTDTQSFEESFSDFVPSIVDEDASELTAYDSDAPAFPAPYNFDNFGSKYLSLDTGDATLWRTNAGDAAYFDMAMQFNPCASAPDIDAETKIAVYLNSDSNLVVMASDGNNGSVANVTTNTLNPGAWGRLTISAVSATAFQVRLNGVLLETAGGLNSFDSITGSTTIKSVGFKGTGALDDFVARTTDPFIANPAVQIGGEGYASIQNALTDAGASSVIELLANNSEAVTLGSGESLKLKKGTYEYTGTITLPDGYVLGTPTTVEGVTTYAQIEGVAKLNGTWYASFDAAYTAAASANTDTLLVKISGDFAPTLSASKAFASVTFTTESAEAIAIATASGDYAMTASTWVAPATATLTLSANQTVASVTAGTLVIAEGVTVTSTAISSDTVTTLVGPGTLLLNNAFPSAKLQNLVTKSDWNGTLEIFNLNGGTWGLYLSQYGNANSTVRLRWGGAGINTSWVGFAGKLEIANTWTLNGSYSGDIVLPCKLAGNGNLKVNATPASGEDPCVLRFAGDVSGFAGNILFDSSNARVAFGSDSGSGGASNIYVHAGSSVTNVGTWTANDVTVAGELVANGTITGMLKGVDGYESAIYRANGNNAAITVDDTWKGTYFANFDMYSTQGTSTVAIKPNLYGTSNSTLVICKALTTAGGYFCANDSLAAPTIEPVLYLKADVTINDGFWSENNATVFTELGADDGVTFTTRSAGSGRPTYYTIKKANNFAGSLVVRDYSKVKIEQIVCDAVPGVNDCVMKVTCTAEGAELLNLNSVKIKVGSAEPQTMAMVYTTKNNVSGLYRAEYAVNFYADSEKTEKVGDTQNVAYGEKATASAAPTKSGYTFTGWDPDTNAVITAATDFVAQWSADGYTVTYNLDLEGATNAVANIPSFTVETPTFTLLDAGCDGYTFEGWTNAQGTAVTTIAGGATGNVTVYASWTKDEPPTPPVTPIDPAAGGERTYADAAAAAAARDAINADKETNIPIPASAATGMTTEQKAAYYNSVTAVAEGTSVKIEFTEAGTNAVQVIVDNAVTNAAFSTAVSAAAAAGSSGSGSATVAAVPGLYYSVESTDDLGTAMTEGDRVLATGTTVTLTVPNKGAAGFYRVKVSPVDKKSVGD